MNLPVHFVVNFVVVKEGRILLEDDPKIGWKLPGGHIEDFEDPIEAVERESLEELKTNIIFLGHPLPSVSDDAHFIPAPFEMFVHKVAGDMNLNAPHRNVGLVYLVGVRSEPLGNEGQKLKWFTKNEIEQSEIHQAVRLICMKAFDIINHH